MKRGTPSFNGERAPFIFPLNVRAIEFKKPLLIAVNRGFEDYATSENHSHCYRSKNYQVDAKASSKNTIQIVRFRGLFSQGEDASLTRRVDRGLVSGLLFSNLNFDAIMAKTQEGKKIVSVPTYRRRDGVVVPAHKRSTPN